MRYSLPLLFCLASFAVADDRELPIVPEGFVVDVVAREPLVSNPCVMAFDRRGRLFVGQGPQWRQPQPDTPGDHVDILIDDDRDGAADRVKRYAEGFNSIQGLAFKGRDLWVANAPDLTIVRDLDGDDEADQYVRVYTGLGNLEHSLHGLNFGPDGKLYMSKGNSKGRNRVDQLAPKAFRELWGLKSPEGAPDYTPVETFSKREYRRNYHTPADDWGQQGGVLRCDVDGRNLEIVSRGFRNPWDIAQDDGFQWLGTDNDQTQGDKIFAPFHGAHFGWGHAWSFDWLGEGHLPTAPASAPLFEGSGTGVVHYHVGHFPPTYRDVFFVNDWLRRRTSIFRPQWDGALIRSEGGTPQVFAHAGGGRAMSGSSGRVYDPTDIEVGPDGALYVLSWGREYGGTFRDGRQSNVGRVYRIRHRASPLFAWRQPHRSRPLKAWSLDQLFADLGSHVPAWRTDAQDELVRRGEEARAFLLAKMREPAAKAAETWGLWTVGRGDSAERSIAEHFAALAADTDATLNARLQAVRILAYRIRQFQRQSTLPGSLRELLKSDLPRLRHAAVQAAWQARQQSWVDDLLELAATETDRIVFYSTWHALRDLRGVDERIQWLNDPRAGVRLSSLLGLLEDDAVAAALVERLQQDSDPRISRLAARWLEKAGGGSSSIQLVPPPGQYGEPIAVTVKTADPKAAVLFTLDGSAPSKTSSRYTGPIPLLGDSTLRVALASDGARAGRVVTGSYRITSSAAYEHRAFVKDVSARSGREYRVDWTGVRPGTRQYTDRPYAFIDVPVALRGLPLLQTANDDDLSRGDHWLQLTSAEDVTLLVGVDVRVDAPLKWMKIGRADGFVDTGLEAKTDDSTFHFYKKDFSAGRVVLGGNTNGSPASSRGNYAVLLERRLLKPIPDGGKATMAAVLAAIRGADPERGRELFLHPRGAGCFKCHQMEGRGSKLAPDLAGIGARLRQPRAIAESILTPSAAITEGFAQQQILTVDGRRLSGAVIEETGRTLKVVDSNGQVASLQKSQIARRQATKLSPMPAGLEKLMTAQQIADIVVWLMTQTTAGDRDGFSFQDSPRQLDIYYAEQRIASYLKDHPQLTRRALAHVTTPGGIQVTREFPPTKQDDSDHPLMHPGIWVSFGDLDGNDYWRLKAKVAFDGFVERPQGDAGRGRFAARNLYMSEDGSRVVCRETTRYRFLRVEQGVLIRLDAEYQSDDRDFYFGDQEESGLAVRVASPIRVSGGNGTILNDRGQRNGKQIWGNEAKWFDYFGRVGGRRVGMMVVSSPKNPRPSWLHARDYGVVATNPFPKQPRERREPYVKTIVKRGQPYRLSYAVLIHDLPATNPLDRAAAYAAALKLLSEE